MIVFLNFTTAQSRLCRIELRRSENSPLELRNASAVDEVDGPVNIAAASAIAGAVAASNELPYMTPPLHAEHFSGDSQDSTSTTRYRLYFSYSNDIKELNVYIECVEGYTSITVREPLARIRPTLVTKRDASDSHYTVLSDDSGKTSVPIMRP